MHSASIVQDSPVSSEPDAPEVRPATSEDRPYVIEAIQSSLDPYYGGDHRAHAERLIQTHLAGGTDARGLLSARQLLLILWDGDKRRGVLNLVFKRQATCKISPLILYPDHHSRGLGSVLLNAAEREAAAAGARQLYCTVALSNTSALGFFTHFGFVKCGEAEAQYKEKEVEVLLRRPLTHEPARTSDRDIISVFEVTDTAELGEVRQLLIRKAGSMVQGVGDKWIDSLILADGNYQLPRAERRNSWVYCARDRTGSYRAAAVIISKKGGSLKIMPIVAADTSAFRALIIDLPTLIANKGRKANMHLTPTTAQVAALQENNWHLEGLIPGAYRGSDTTQQWGCPLGRNAPMTTLRIHSKYLALIDKGQKTLEIRVGYPHIKEIKPGNTIKLVANTKSIICHVADVRTYPSLMSMVDVEDVERAVPGVTPDKALAQLQEIYPPEKEKLGIYVIELKKS